MADRHDFYRWYFKNNWGLFILMAVVIFLMIWVMP